MKMLVVLGGLLLFLFSTGLAQGRLSLAPTIQFDRGSYVAKARSNYVHGDEANYMGNTLGYSLGLTAHYYVTDRWDLSLGTLRTQLTDRAEIKLLNPSRPTGTWTQDYNYYQVPISLNYRSSQKRLGAYISLGAILSNQPIMNNLARVKTSAFVGVGINYQLAPKLSLLLQPTVSYLFSKPKDSTSLIFEMYQSSLLGLQMQLLWRP